MLATLESLGTRRDGDVVEHRAALRFAPGTLPAAEITVRVRHAGAALGDPTVLHLIPAALVLCSRAGHDLRVREPVPHALHEGAAQAMAVLHRWYGWRPAELMAPISAEAAPRRGGGIGLFFTRGVDSWGTYLEREHGPRPARPTHLITMDADIHLPPAVRQEVLDGTRLAAQELGLPLLEVQTDVRGLLDPHLNWGTEAHGAVLAGIGLLLQPVLREVVISPTHWTPLVRPWGSHPDLDPCWSVPRLRVTHHSGDEVRWRRVERIAADPRVQRSLLVCWEGGASRNCGRCEKCLRTMTSLHLAGQLARCADRFEAPFDPTRIGSTLATTPPPWCDTMDHLDHVGIEADALRQRWEQANVLARPGVWYQQRPIQPRLPLRCEGVDALDVARALAPLGLRVDHEARPTADEPHLAARAGARGGEACVSPDTSGSPGSWVPLGSLTVEVLAPLLASLGVGSERCVPFDPDGQAPPPVVPEPPGWPNVPDSRLALLG